MADINQNSWAFQSSASISVAGGVSGQPSCEQEEESLHKGVKFILLLSGSLRCEFPVLGLIDITGPCLCAVLNDGDHIALQTFDSDKILEYVAVSLDHQTSQILLGSDGYHIAQSTGAKLCNSTPCLIQRPLDHSLSALGRQMLTCTLRPGAASLYLIGKGYELGGLAAHTICSDAIGLPPPKLSTADINRLHEAKRILLASLYMPPDMATLSRQVGINIRKLTTGFDAMFGMTPSNFLQHARLEAAHRMISTGECSIAQAAWQVGYTPAAFSTAFRRRFGVPPSYLRNRHFAKV